MTIGIKGNADGSVTVTCGTDSIVIGGPVPGPGPAPAPVPIPPISGGGVVIASLRESRDKQTPQTLFVDSEEDAKSKIKAALRSLGVDGRRLEHHFVLSARLGESFDLSHLTKSVRGVGDGSVRLHITFDRR